LTPLPKSRVSSVDSSKKSGFLQISLVDYPSYQKSGIIGELSTSVFRKKALMFPNRGEKR